MIESIFVEKYKGILWKYTFVDSVVVEKGLVQMFSLGLLNLSRESVFLSDEWRIVQLGKTG